MNDKKQDNARNSSLTIRISEPDKKRLQDTARAQKISASELVNDAVQSWLNSRSSKLYLVCNSDQMLKGLYADAETALDVCLHSSDMNQVWEFDAKNPGAWRPSSAFYWTRKERKRGLLGTTESELESYDVGEWASNEFREAVEKAVKKFVKKG